ncbi:MAG: hypothetical protein ACOCZH_02705 [Phototrophicaceae bacterium]
MPRDDDLLNKVQDYRRMVLAYEELNHQINELLDANAGSTDKMSPEDRARYRQLARQRDEVQHEMRWLEQQLMDDDSAQSVE